jgi:hypothetical protein
MRRFFTLLLLLNIFNVFGQDYENVPFDCVKRAYDSLYKSTNGNQWIIKDFNELKNREGYPSVTCKRYIATVREEIRDIYLMFNNLTGEIPESFNPVREITAEDPLWLRYGNRRLQYSHLNFSHNKITKVAPNISWGGREKSVWLLDLSHNQLTKLQLEALPKVGLGGITGGIVDLSVSNNKITSLTGDDLWLNGTSVYDLSIAAYVKRVDISNNYLNFNHILSVKGAIDQKSGHYGTGVYEYIASPQKYSEPDADPQFKNENDIANLSYSMPHANNQYQWFVNGQEVDFANTKDIEIKNIDKYKAGVYRCRVTNPGAPGVELFSHAFPVFINKDDNQNPSDFKAEYHIPRNYPRLALACELTGTDPDDDELFFRLVDNENNADNYSFRMVNGNTLMAAEELFKYDSITEYKIKIEAYDVYGGTLTKTVTIKPGKEDVSGITLPDQIAIDGNKLVAENQSDIVIGKIFAQKFNDAYGQGTWQNLDEYSYELVEGNPDNKYFTIENENQIRLVKPLNYEDKTIYKIKVKVNHKTADYSLNTFVNIKVKNVNDNPSDIILSANKVLENQKTGVFIGVLATFDEDEADTAFSYQLVDGEGSEGNGYVSIQNGMLRSNKTFDYSKINAFSVRIKSSDSNDGFIEKQFNIIVEKAGTGQNSAPTDIYLSNTTVSANIKTNDIIGVLATVDDDNNDNFYYTVLEGGDKVKLINNILKPNTTFTAGESFKVKIKSVDSGNAEIIKSFTIKVTDGQTTDIDNDINKNDISIYPNPVSDYIIVTTNKPVNQLYRIYSHTGQLVKSGLINTKEGGRFRINLNLNSGLYVFKTEGYSSKLIVR